MISISHSPYYYNSQKTKERESDDKMDGARMASVDSEIKLVVVYFFFSLYFVFVKSNL